MHDQKVMLCAYGHNDWRFLDVFGSLGGVVVRVFKMAPSNFILLNLTLCMMPGGLFGHCDVQVRSTYGTRATYGPQKNFNSS